MYLLSMCQKTNLRFYLARFVGGQGGGEWHLHPIIGGEHNKCEYTLKSIDSQSFIVRLKVSQMCQSQLSFRPVVLKWWSSTARMSFYSSNKKKETLGF
jgi:hypothetical protein